MIEPYFETRLGKLFHGDCLELLPEIPDSSVDLILCDLPYGTTDLAWDKKIPLEPIARQYQRIITEHGAIVLTAQMPFVAELYNALNPLVKFRQELIWEKSSAMGFFDAKKRVLRAHENILIFYKHLPVYNPQFTQGKPYTIYHGKDRAVHYKNHKECVTDNSTGRRYPRSVLHFAQDSIAFPFQEHDTRHPTAKPQLLFEWLVKTYTNEGMTVLDNCIGGGTTAAACENLNRLWIGMEISEEFCAMTKKRIQRHAGWSGVQG